MVQNKKYYSLQVIISFIKMIQTYIDKLIENLPDSIKTSKEPIQMDLILDGGIFNGSYLIGALHFLKEMEKRKYIKINKISGCSIGSISAFLYLIDELEVVSSMYDLICKDLKEFHHVNKIKEIGIILREKIPEDICSTINDRLFITYYHIGKKKKMVKSQYKSKEELVDILIRSCFVPFFIDGNILYKEKYMDGINPYLFPGEKKIKRLHLDLFGYDKISYLMNVKNEKSNFHRVLTGLLDIHNFFIKQSSTHMCSYMEDWSITHKIHNRIKISLESILIWLIYCLLFIKKYISPEMESTILYRFLSKMMYELYILCLETYTL
jgi:hypothetical protein